jgi:hypothetical protein
VIVIQGTGSVSVDNTTRHRSRLKGLLILLPSIELTDQVEKRFERSRDVKECSFLLDNETRRWEKLMKKRRREVEAIEVV